MSQNKIQVGSLVSLVSSSVNLLVVSVGDSFAHCIWLDKNLALCEYKALDIKILVLNEQLEESGNMRFEVGELVKVGGFGVQMVVKQIISDNSIQCCWFDKNDQFHRTSFPSKFIVRVS